MEPQPSKKKGKQPQKEDLVLTPGGWRPRSKVHAVEPGQQIDVEGGHLKIIDTETGTVVKDLGDVEPERPKKRRSGTRAQGRNKDTG